MTDKETGLKNDILLTAEGICKTFFRKTGGANYFFAVAPLDLEVLSGSVTVLTGRSGSGKTTLLNMLAGLLEPTEGKVRLGGTDLYSLKDDALSRFRNERIGVVPQARSAVDTLTVKENILLPASLYGRKAEEKEILDRMEAFGIGHLADAMPPELSGGELRRMAIVRALVSNPDILFADEPTGDLDDENTEKVMKMLYSFAHKRTSNLSAGCAVGDRANRPIRIGPVSPVPAGPPRAVFIVTHESDALKYADRVFRMENGQIVKM